MLAPLLLLLADLSGVYELRGVMEVASGLELKADGTFEYGFIYGAADYFAKGKWRQDGNAVILDTDIIPEPPFRLVRSSPGTAGVVRVRVVAPNGRGIPNIDAVLAGEKGRTDQDGWAELPPAKSLESLRLIVRVYSVEAGPFQLNPEHHEFTFEINGPAITQVPFRSERLTWNGTELELKFWGKPLRYRKQ